MVVLTDLRLISGPRLHEQDLNQEGVGPTGTFPSPLKNSRIWTSWLLQIFPNQNLECSKVLAFVTGCWWALLYAEDRKREVPFILPGFHIHQTAHDPMIQVTDQFCIWAKARQSKYFPVSPSETWKTTKLVHPWEPLKKGESSPYASGAANILSSFSQSTSAQGMRWRTAFQCWAWSAAGNVKLLG